jgi:hypothetical protein
MFKYFMKKAVIVTCFIFMVLVSVAQDWNPYVKNGAANPDPLLPVEFKGIGDFSFQLGNDGPSLPLVKNQEMTLVITLSFGIPGNTDPLTSIGGTWASKFIWSYDASVKSFLAVQNQEIPGYSEGSIVINYQVDTNSPETNPSNGLKVNIQPPPYTNGVNLTDDDDLSVYSFVRAKDFSDAPNSYGIASHVINIQKNPETGEYENYIYLGHTVDPEPSELFSETADGDDISGADDEDGVIFPLLVQGDTARIKVIVTVHDFGSGMLNAWFDWNGDGDFNDSGEKIPNPVNVFESDTLVVPVVVPSGAITAKSTFARFRLGNNKVISPVGESPWGEVEDYIIHILKAPQIAVEKVLISNSDHDKSGSLTVDDLMTYSIKITNNENEVLSNITVSDDKLSLSQNLCTSLKPGESCVLVGTYKIKPDDIITGNLKSTTTVGSDGNGPVRDSIILF